jgi:hypothetical protein
VIDDLHRIPVALVRRRCGAHPTDPSRSPAPSNVTVPSRSFFETQCASLREALTRSARDGCGTRTDHRKGAAVSLKCGLFQDNRDNGSVLGSPRRTADERGSLRMRLPATVSLGPICLRTSGGYRRCDCGVFGVGRRAVRVVYRLVAVPRDAHAGANCEQFGNQWPAPAGHTAREHRRWQRLGCCRYPSPFVPCWANWLPPPSSRYTRRGRRVLAAHRERRPLALYRPRCPRVG